MPRPCTSVDDGSPPPAWGLPRGPDGVAGPVRLTPTCVGTSGDLSVNRRKGPAHPHLRGDFEGPQVGERGGHGSPPPAWGLRTDMGRRHSVSWLTPTCVGTSPPGRRACPAAPAHPHLRGDFGCGPGAGPRTDGSPPPAWGLPDHPRKGAIVQRLTPTCVGTSAPGSPRRAARAAHPHLRGDFGAANGSTVERAGSPPPAWGLQRARLEKLDTARLTPTCVGTSDEAPTGIPVGAAHPHLRGDFPDTIAPITLGIGSPPPAWGLRGTAARRRACTWLTPTCVGTSVPQSRRRDREPAHPHLRGDFTPMGAAVTLTYGSPPPAWGLLLIALFTAPAMRLTPTCVGTSYAGVRGIQVGSAHPHLRGDFWQRGTTHGRPGGSPPPAWGLLRDPAPDRRAGRLTPTCVGTSSRPAPRASRVAAHPHLRGDFAGAHLAREGRHGSPPPAWGLRLWGPGSRRYRWLTPTCVGTSC